MATWAGLVSDALRLAGVSESVSYGEPSLKVGRSLLTRYRIADDSIVLKGVDVDERDLLIRRDPDVFFLEDHYVGYDLVLARLAPANHAELMRFIERTWASLAPRRLRQG